MDVGLCLPRVLHSTVIDPSRFESRSASGRFFRPLPGDFRMTAMILRDQNQFPCATILPLSVISSAHPGRCDLRTSRYLCYAPLLTLQAQPDANKLEVCGYDQCVFYRRSSFSRPHTYARYRPWHRRLSFPRRPFVIRRGSQQLPPRADLHNSRHGCRS